MRWRSVAKASLFSSFIAAASITTYEEYNRYMAQSKGIVRRFQQIDIKEPTEEEAIKILEGLQYKYNKFHNVTYRKDALEYAVRASAKYISNRCLPDKAIDLMDEAGTSVFPTPVGPTKRSEANGLSSSVNPAFAIITASTTLSTALS